MAERKNAPVDAEAPVEPRTRRGRRRLDEVEVTTAKRRADFDEKQRQRRVSTRNKTAEMAELEKQAALKAKQRAQRVKDAKRIGLATLRNLMVIGPIIAPMTVAWTGQSGFAKSVLGWNFAASLVYAAAYELTTVFSAWMYHEARKDGDKGWEYRLATWIFAAGAGVQQWWHYSKDWEATPRSVTYSTMTIVGVLVWELYARLIHRRALRKVGKLTNARPAIGLARWFRYPRISWTAWSMAVRRNFDSFEEMWTLAEVEMDRRTSERSKVKDLRTQVKELQTQLANVQIPAQIEPTPDPEVTVERVKSDPDTATLDPRSGDASPKAIEAGPSNEVEDPEDDDTFRPTQQEIEAVERILDRGERLNRTNCADEVRKTGAIATKRAALLAAWGRENYPNGPGLKAVQ